LAISKYSIHQQADFRGIGIRVSGAKTRRRILLNRSGCAMVFEPRGPSHLSWDLAKLAFKDISNVGKNGDGGRDS
jgi:hypothetical protein